MTPGKDSIDPVLIFLHIPKTAGTAFRSVLRNRYGPDRVAEVWGGPGVPPDPSEMSLEEFCTLPEGKRASMKAVMGHFGFGIHEWIPRPSVYVTLLRDPVARRVSQFRYFRGRPHLPLGHAIRQGLSFERFLVEDLDNFQTRMLARTISSPRGWTPPPWRSDPCSDERLESAKRHLERFAVVGLQHRFREFVLLVGDLVGWKGPIPYGWLNVAPPDAQALREEDLARIKEVDRFDMELWDFACELYSHRLKEKGPLFSFRARSNSLTSHAWNWLKTAKRSLARTSFGKLVRRTLGRGQ